MIWNLLDSNSQRNWIHRTTQQRLWQIYYLKVLSWPLRFWSKGMHVLNLTFTVLAKYSRWWGSLTSRVKMTNRQIAWSFWIWVHLTLGTDPLWKKCGSIWNPRRTKLNFLIRMSLNFKLAIEKILIQFLLLPKGDIGWKFLFKKRLSKRRKDV